MACNTDALEARYARLAASVRSGNTGLGATSPGDFTACPDDCIGDHLYGFDSAAPVPAGATVTVTANPQLRNQPRRLFLNQGIADGFLIEDIQVGVMPLLATTGPISPACFIPQSNVPNFKRLINEVNQPVAITVTNISGAALRFTATMAAYIVA